MQEIRVKRGWSYGAGCALRRSRLPHWFEIWMAAGIDVAGPGRRAHASICSPTTPRTARPTTRSTSARSYLIRLDAGSTSPPRASACSSPCATPWCSIFAGPGSPPGLEALGALAALPTSAPPASASCGPDDAVRTVAVTTAEQAGTALAAAGAGALTVVDHDEWSRATATPEAEAEHHQAAEADRQCRRTTAA